ncbi:MarR family transcriptional regulator [Actinorhabdospora filicis]|uniref:MarR family transcriptional regulator n=1 Tax=Actinorhabdospora filicis TaxID=1785913 RepID=A0A9W6SID9_9ACTN|nr:MarR family transcriptional regulator [Actinorhabdospora filicis]GLZ75206.1 MarR family transcriptional regulator [Actinorhabdospora filicis]
MTDETDAVDRITGQWARELPDMGLRAMEVFGRVHRVSQHTARLIDPIYARHGIGRAEFDVLASLRRSGEPYTLSPKQISGTLMLTSGGLTGRLDKLEKAGLIERLPDPDDRRALRVRLTDAGRTAVEAAVRAGVEAQQKILDVLTPDEQAVLAGLLRRVHLAYTGEL